MSSTSIHTCTACRSGHAVRSIEPIGTTVSLQDTASSDGSGGTPGSICQPVDSRERRNLCKEVHKEVQLTGVRLLTWATTVLKSAVSSVISA